MGCLLPLAHSTLIDAEAAIQVRLGLCAVPREGRANTRVPYKRPRGTHGNSALPLRRQRALIREEEAAVPTTAFLRTSHSRSPPPVSTSPNNASQKSMPMPEVLSWKSPQSHGSAEAGAFHPHS